MLAGSKWSSDCCSRDPDREEARGRLGTPTSGQFSRRGPASSAGGGRNGTSPIQPHGSAHQRKPVKDRRRSRLPSKSRSSKFAPRPTDRGRLRVARSSRRVGRSGGGAYRPRKWRATPDPASMAGRRSLAPTASMARNYWCGRRDGRKSSGIVILEVVILKSGRVGPARDPVSSPPDSTPGGCGHHAAIPSSTRTRPTRHRRPAPPGEGPFFDPGRFRGEDSVDVLAEIEVEFRLL